LTLRLSD